MRILHQSRSKFLWNECTSDMIGVYSFRKVIKNYTGPCIRVIRPSDFAEQDIGFLNNVLDIDSLLSFCGSENGHIRIWYDQAALCSNHDLDPTPWGTRGPQIVTAGVLNTENGKPCAIFGYREWLHSYPGKIDFGTDISIFVVAKLTSNSGYISPLVSTGTGYYCFLGADINNLVSSYYGDGVSWGYETANSSQSWLNNRLLVTSINNGYDNQFINGNAITPRYNPMTAHSYAILYVSNCQNYTNRNNNWHGNVQELIVYNADKSTNRSYIENNMNNYYGIY